MNRLAEMFSNYSSLESVHQLTTSQTEAECAGRGKIRTGKVTSRAQRERERAGTANKDRILLIFFKL